MKILIAPWGDPKGWDEILYSFKGRDKNSRTSLKILVDTIQPDKLFIIGLDTLIEEKVFSYVEVVEKAKNKLSTYCKDFEIKSSEIIIAPGVGEFSHNIFKGNALDYYYYITAKLIEKFLEHYDEEFEVHLDLTHGINFMPVLTYRSVKEILEILSIFTKVNFIVYNADPYIKNITKSLSINIIEEGKIFSRAFNSGTHDHKILTPRDLIEEERRKLYEDELKILRNINMKEISAFLGSIYNGLPLALFSFFPDLKILNNIIPIILDIYRRYIKIEVREKLEVKRRLEFNEKFKILLFVYLISNLLEKNNIISERKLEVKLKEIKELNSKLFKFDKRSYVRIDKEVYNLEKDIKDKNIDQWKLYNEILERNIGEIDQRNFLAHAGFEGNSIEVKKEDKELLLRYKQEQKETIKNLCMEGLSMI